MTETSKRTDWKNLSASLEVAARALPEDDAQRALMLAAVARIILLEKECEFLHSRRGDLAIERDKAREALDAADVAINPPDRAGISLDAWNDRLAAATTVIRAARAYDNRKARLAADQAGD